MVIRDSRHRSLRVATANVLRARRRLSRSLRCIDRVFIRAAESADALRLKSRQVVFFTRRISPFK